MVSIGKDLNGNELGNCITQRKNGKYEYKKIIDGKRKSFYAKTYEEILYLKEYIEMKITQQKYNVIPPEKRDGFVYFISDGSYCKIGSSKNMEGRLKDLQVANPKKLEIVFEIKSIDYINIEKRLHELFSKYKVNGEWYDILFLFKKDDEINGKK